MNFREIFDYLDAEYGTTVSKDEFVARYRERAETLYSEEVTLMDGARELFAAIRESGRHLAIVSSSPPAWIETVRDRFDLGPLDLQLSAEDIDDPGKPEPHIYERAAAELGLEPWQCVVVEDSENGARAAHRAGCYTVGYRTELNRETDLSVADEVVEGPAALRATLLGDGATDAAADGGRTACGEDGQATGDRGGRARGDEDGRATGDQDGQGTEEDGETGLVRRHGLVPDDDWESIVRYAPVVSVDLVVLAPTPDDREGVVLALRENEPARGEWFVPGGRVQKGERLADAVHRVARQELGVEVTVERHLGVYEHLYDTADVDGAGGKHYVPVAYVVRTADTDFALDDQHGDVRVFAPESVPDDVHPYTATYLADAGVCDPDSAPPELRDDVDRDPRPSTRR